MFAFTHINDTEFDLIVLDCWCFILSHGFGNSIWTYFSNIFTAPSKDHHQHGIGSGVGWMLWSVFMVHSFKFILRMKFVALEGKSAVCFNPFIIWVLMDYYSMTRVCDSYCFYRLHCVRMLELRRSAGLQSLVLNCSLMRTSRIKNNFINHIRFLIITLIIVITHIHT